MQSRWGRGSCYVMDDRMNLLTKRGTEIRVSYPRIIPHLCRAGDKPTAGVITGHLAARWRDPELRLPGCSVVRLLGCPPPTRRILGRWSWGVAELVLVCGVVRYQDRHVCFSIFTSVFICNDANSHKKAFLLCPRALYWSLPPNSAIQYKQYKYYDVLHVFQHHDPFHCNVLLPFLIAYCRNMLYIIQVSY